MSDAAVASSAAWVAGYWRDQSSFVEACRAAVAEGRKPHAVTPWPVHGLDQVLGIPRSLLGRPVLTVIILGFALGTQQAQCLAGGHHALRGFTPRHVPDDLSRLLDQRGGLVNEIPGSASPVRPAGG